MNEEENENPEEILDRQLESNKINLKNEERTMDQYKASIPIIEKKRSDMVEQLLLEKDETELLIKLYPKHGENYIEAEEWKKHMQKKFAFILRMNKRKSEANEKAYKMQLRATQQNVSHSEKLIKDYRREIKQIKIEKKQAIDDKKSMTG